VTITPEELAAGIERMKDQCPDMHTFIKDMFNAKLIDGLRSLEYIEINGEQFGTDEYTNAVKWEPSESS